MNDKCLQILRGSLAVYGRVMPLSRGATVGCAVEVLDAPEIIMSLDGKTRRNSLLLGWDPRCVSVAACATNVYNFFSFYWHVFTACRSGSCSLMLHMGLTGKRVGRSRRSRM